MNMTSQRRARVGASSQTSDGRIQPPFVRPRRERRVPLRLLEYSIRPARETDLDGLFRLVAEFAASFVPERKCFDQAFPRLLGDDHACADASPVKCVMPKRQKMR